jgi:galactose mutarotase-like enzyme
MSVRFSDAWTLHGFRALVVENRELHVTILPELGGKIWSIVAKRHDREMLWHNSRMAPRPAHYDAAYDNWFCGGWDEVFPNDYPVTIDGEPYPDHGEVWSMPMRWEVLERTEAVVTIALEQQGIAIPTRFRKIITLRDGEADLLVRYEITNEGASPLDVQLKLHPALPLAPGARLHLPARRILVDEGFEDAFGTAEFAWPDAPLPDGGRRDLRALPAPDAREAWFFYGLELDAGYSAVSYPDDKAGFGISFDPALFT